MASQTISFSSKGELPELPILVGSEKQVFWAAKIRQNLIRANKGNFGSNTFRACLAISDARFWIETRTMNFLEMGAVASNIECGHTLAESLYKARGREKTCP